MRNPHLFLNLSQHAEAFLNASAKQNQSVSYDEIYQLVNDLNLYQVEREILSEELQNVTLELEEYRSKYIDLCNFLPCGYFMLDQCGSIIEINEAASNLLGIGKRQLLNRNFSRYIAPNYQHIFIEHYHSALNSDKLQTVELKLLRKDGPIFHAQLSSKVIKNLITNEKMLITFINDIGNRSDKEEYLHYYQNKMVTNERNSFTGELACIIAHELNHPLSIISNFLHGCIRRLESDQFNSEEIIRVLKQASEQSHRIAEIVLRMKNFTCTGGSLSCEQISINDLMHEAIYFLNCETYTPPIDIQYSPIKNIPDLFIDKIHIEQVILNLARNAIESMRDAEVSHPRLIIEANQISLAEVEICIIDNGPGILPDNLHKLFNPYFTSKPYGVGIGLMVSRTIIKAHGGELFAESNPFGGACFKFTLPLIKTNKLSRVPI